METHTPFPMVPYKNKSENSKELERNYTFMNSASAITPESNIEKYGPFMEVKGTVRPD
jgi:hypothetical protein